jgi:hypothetical protein
MGATEVRVRRQRDAKRCKMMSNASSDNVRNLEMRA